MHLTGPYADDLVLALTIADRADALTMAGYTAGLDVEIKDDQSPVTAADRDTEALVRSALETARPDDAFRGEESGVSGVSPRQWVIDPIDGTKNFIRSVPVWATLIALVDNGKPVVGVVSAPALGMRWFAAAGDGAWKGSGVDDAAALRVSKRSELSEASLSYSSLDGWEQRSLLPQFLALTQQVWRTRAFGDFWSYMLVAEGAVDFACEPELSLWDMAALVPIVEEAGGTFTSLDGAPGPWGGDALASNGALHSRVLDQLGTRTALDL